MKYFYNGILFQTYKYIYSPLNKITQEKPIFVNRGKIDSIGMICCCINSAFGLGSLQLGFTFTSGLITSYLLLIIVGFFSFYSLKLLVLSATIFRQSTFEEIWRVAFSNSTIFIPIIVIIISTIADLTTYFRTTQSFVISMCANIYLLRSEHQDFIFTLEKYKMLFGCITFVIFTLPVSFVTDFKKIVIISYHSIAFIAILIIYILGVFSYRVKKYGFDPDHSLKLFNFHSQFAKSLASSVFSFGFYPLSYPGIRDVRDSTKSNLLFIFRITTFIIFIVYMIIGTLSYFMFFDKNTGGFILDYFSDSTNSEKILLIFGYIIAFFNVLFTVPFRLNSCRYTILHALSSSNYFPLEIWVFSGIAISLFAFALSNLSNKLINVFYILADIITSILMFVFTPLFYLKGYGRINRFNAFMSVLLLIFGFATAITMTFYNGFHN